MGPPASSCTTPVIAPEPTHATRTTAASPDGMPVCACAGSAIPRSIRPPTIADAVLDGAMPVTPRALCTPSRSGDCDVHVACQRLVRETVGDLDLEAIVTLGKRRQLDRLAALQLVAGGKIERGRQRLRVEVLRIGLVAEFLGA